MLNNKKWRKLRRDPKLFFSDMYLKRREQFSKFKPKRKYITGQKFTVVSAVYGVEKYLNDYFESLVEQTISFKNNIHLILVDDDSKDNAANIIKRWVKKYPQNITYIHKENGGQASARNMGLELVRTKWVTFIDPDDFVSRDFFEELAKIIEESDKGHSIGLINCNLIFYRENTRQYQDNHPLRYKFIKGNQTVTGLNLENNINLSASSSIFDIDIIKKYQLKFDNRVRPTFEDGRFIAEYLYYIPNQKVVFSAKSKYFYRKREDESSTIDRAWLDKRKYNDIFVHGYLFVLQFYYTKYNHVPIHIQRQVLYDLVWYCRYLLDNPSSLNLLDVTEKNSFYFLMKKTFSFIDKKTILDFELAGIWFFFKVAILGKFKDFYNIKQIAYIERFDKSKRQFLISYNTYNEVNIIINFDGQDTIPIYQKQVKHTFGDDYFITTHKMWISLPHSFNKFDIKINGKPVRININGKVFNNTISDEELINNLSSLINKHEKTHWILLDRDVQADDNGEHLYRHIKEKHPEQIIYFALSKKSHDWDRLLKENFNLIDFGSKKYEILLKTASKIISSHAEKYIHNYFSDNSMLKQKFIFLQHGVIKDDLSKWLNGKPNIDLMLTSTEAEWQSITLNEKYYLTEKQVLLTGLPRHNRSYSHHQNIKDNSHQKTILIMPTWRSYILTDIKSNNSSARIKNPFFMQTNYAKHWQKLLLNEHLYQLSKNNNIKIIFAPHKNIELYLDEFNIPDYIETWKSQHYSIQKLFQISTLMVTDYSSVAFDMAYLEKQVIYYQFDEDEMFSGKHTFTKGYFDYRRDGFGPVSTNEQDLISILNKIIDTGFSIEEPYRTRIKNVFPYRDGENSERVYQAIVSLDKPEDSNKINSSILSDFTNRAYKNQEWHSAEKRANLLLQLGNQKQQILARSILAEVSYQQHKLISTEYSHLNSNRVKAFLLMSKENWLEASYIWVNLPLESSYDLFYTLICYERLDNLYQATAAYEKYIVHHPVSLEESRVFQSIILSIKKEWHNVIDMLTPLINQNVNMNFLRFYQPELRLARAYRHLNNVKKSNEQLVNFENHTSNNVDCRIEIARLAFAKKNYKKSIDQLEKAFEGNYKKMPNSILEDYILSLESSIKEDMNRLLTINKYSKEHRN